MLETSQPTPESLDSLKPVLRQELLSKAAEAGITDEKELFRLILKEHELTENQVYKTIFSVYQNLQQEYGLGNMNVAPERVRDEAVISFVRNYVLMLTLPEEPVKSEIDAIDPNNLMIPSNTLKELAEADIEPYELSNLKMYGRDQLRINVSLLRGVPRVAGFKDGAMIEPNWGMLDDLEKIVGDRERMMRIFATLKKWEQENNAKLTQTGKIVR